MVEKDLKASGAEAYLAFLGEGESFRTELSTILKYKDRANLLKPVLIDEVTEYLRKKFKAQVVSHIENDDKVVMECFKRPDRFANQTRIFGAVRSLFGIATSKSAVLSAATSLGNSSQTQKERLEVKDESFSTGKFVLQTKQMGMLPIQQQMLAGVTRELMRHWQVVRMTNKHQNLL